eukprot:CCRYP_002563-RC/>CCRYP_002563-RC protein AED:0.46 eAED:0.46 QI:0/-1/0/1/-1/0/1/0/31
MHTRAWYGRRFCETTLVVKLLIFFTELAWQN